MNISEIAKKLGSRGGLKRAKNLSSDRRREIAKLGAKARTESIQLANRFRSNFTYLKAVRKFAPPIHVISESSIKGKLPGIYERQIKN